MKIHFLVLEENHYPCVLLEVLPAESHCCTQIRPVRRKLFWTPNWTLAVNLSRDSQTAQILYVSNGTLSGKTVLNSPNLHNKIGALELLGF